MMMVVIVVMMDFAVHFIIGVLHLLCCLVPSRGLALVKFC